MRLIAFKILQRVLAELLLKHCWNENLFSRLQAGFQREHICRDQIEGIEGDFQKKKTHTRSQSYYFIT